MSSSGPSSAAAERPFISPDQEKPGYQHLPELYTHLTEVSAARGHIYSETVAFLLRWQADDTEAIKDVNSMRILCQQYFHIDEVTECVLTPEDKSPGLTAHERIRQSISKFIGSQRRTLFLFFYAGHGTMFNGSFFLADRENGRKIIRWESISQIFLDPAESLNNTDVLFILDCCHSACAADKLQCDSERACQILAASRSKALARKGADSFTGKLWAAFHHFRSLQCDYLSINEWFSQAKESSNRVEPHIAHLGSCHPIILNLNKPDESTSPVSPTSSTLQSPGFSRIPVPKTLLKREKAVLVKLSLSGRYNDFKGFEKFLADLPQHMQAEILDAYKIEHSFTCIMRMPWLSFASWIARVELHVIEEVIGESWVRGIHPAPALAGPEHEPWKKENVPFRSPQKEKIIR